MFLLFIPFAVFRIQIGVLRVAYNMTGNAAISLAHAYAFIFWGIADLIVMVMLVMYTFQYVRENSSAAGM